jgi:hypothetical protein
MQHGEAFIYEMRRVKGKFMETMELNDFPFDVQVKNSYVLIYVRKVRLY